MMRALNKTAETRITQYGKVEIDALLSASPNGLHKVENAEANYTSQDAVAFQNEVEQVPSCCVKKTCSSTDNNSTVPCASETLSVTQPRAESRFGITSFVYRTERVMSWEKLYEELNKWQHAREALGDKLNLEGLTSDTAQLSNT